MLFGPTSQVKLTFGGPQPGYPQGVSTEWTYNYVINDIKDGSGQGIGAAFASQDSVMAPVDTLLIADGWPVKDEPAFDEERMEYNWVWGERDIQNNPLHDRAPRHRGTFNIMFLDGHLKPRPRVSSGKKFSSGTRDEEWLVTRGPSR